MTTPKTSQNPPIVATVKWGRIELEDGRSFKDLIVAPGVAQEWDWKRTGTSHSPGISRADLEFLLERGARILILSSGYMGRLKISPAAQEFLREHKLEYYYLSTPKAVTKFNALAKHEPVGALFHTTC